MDSNILVYMMAVEYVGLAIGLLYWAYHSKIRTVFKVVFFKQTTLGHYERVGQKEFKRDASDVTYKTSDKILHNVEIDLQKIAYRDARQTILYYDLDSDCYLTFGGEYYAGNSKNRGLVLKRNAMGVLLEKIKGVDNIVYIIVIVAVIAIAFAFVAGLFAGPYILPAQNATTVTPPPCGVAYE